MTTIKNKVKNSENASVNMETGEIIDQKVPTIHTALTANQRKKDYEKNPGKSKTVPGQSQTIAQLVERHRKGLPIDQSKGALYQGDELLPDISKMDLIDRQAYIDSVADALVEVRTRIDESAKTEKEKAIVARIDQAIREELKKINSKNTVTDIEEEK